MIIQFILSFIKIQKINFFAKIFGKNFDQPVRAPLHFDWPVVESN